ncbi:PfkB family carbohydrate kinase [Conexibacter sp. S30A1]|uniref:PfkB family carbohydrate kinase n=1 Tax=Conexibacter sp. S30A1 TaxID=2937800 RepID=UPI00200EBB37|nr:PfkB family carbohydrate kinase [Conexibacter sp. S30A1]
MSITVVGSIAYDAVRTPFGERRRMLGGAATHFALAASFFDTVRPVGPVGGDFATEDLRTLSVRGTITDDVVTVPGGETFFWSGVYGDDLNSRETLATELGVFADFQPRLSPAARACEVLFLANIQPSLQASVLDQCDGPRFTALDSMNLWIETARAELIAVIERVDCVILNDAEIRQLTGRHTLPDAARELLELGPEAVIAKQGEYGAALFTRDGFFSLPAYPLVSVVDPTGAGDTFAGGLVGYVAAARERTVSRELLAGAMAYGTALASFNVQEFGTERLARLSFDEVHARVAELHRFTQFEMPLLKETV